MKKSWIPYLAIAGALFLAVGYWIITRPSGSEEVRTLITSNDVQPLQSEPVAPPMTKKEAYEERLRESTEDQAKLDFARDNQRPQKLAESVTRAMKSPYEKKLEELKSERSTVPVYNGKPFSLSPEMEEPSITISLVEQPVVMKRYTSSKKKQVDQSPPTIKREIHSTYPTALPATVEEESAFNTTTIPSLPTPSTEAVISSQQPIKAAVFGEQEIKAGGLLKFRLLERVMIEGNMFERNTFFIGRCTFGQDRLLVNVDKMPLAGGGYKQVELTVHDPKDYQEGLFAPSDMTKEGAVQAATDGVQDIISSVPVPGANIGSGVAQLFKTAVNGTPKITVPDGRSVLFLTK